jgi:hypothetical protein
MSLLLVILAMFGDEGEGPTPPPPSTPEYLLKEDGFFFLLENGDKLLLE